MSIADKLTQIAENQQKVYDAGYAAGQAQGGGEDRYKEGYDDGYQVGEREGYDDGLIRSMTDYVRRCNSQKNFLSAFAGVGWRNTSNIQYIATYRPTEDMVFDCTTNSTNMYHYSGVSDTVATIDLRQAGGNAKTTFAYAQNLVTVRRVLVSETTPGLNFTGCSKLQSITVDGVIGASWNLSSSPLTNETVQHLIDHLADLTGGTAQTLTLKATVGAALTDEQNTAISAKNWTLAY